jgi:hypothetical protein
MTTHILIAVVVIWVGGALLAATYAWAREFSPLATGLAALFMGFPLVVLAVAIGDGLRDSIEGGAGK